MDERIPTRQSPTEWHDVDLRAMAAQARAENFPVALRLLPRRPRAQLERVYSYARFVDDLGDEAPGDRTALLNRVEHDVHKLYDGVAELAPVRQLRPVLDQCDVPIQPFLDLIEANRVDQVVHKYQSFEQLLGYCRLSAAPVGRIVLHLAGEADQQNVADSDQVCAALQLLEHCQDVREDARAGRLYLPGLDGLDLTATATSAPVRAVVRGAVERAEQLLQPGRGLVRRLPGWSKVAVAGYVGGGFATADALRAGDYDVLSRHLGPAKLRTARRMLQLLVGR